MPYNARNLFYLRISSQAVIPLYIYLDERHFEWMSDRILQRVVSDLRPLILPKLKAESDAHLGPGGPPNAKRGTVDVHRGDSYQFAYFLRKAESHSVLIKTRDFVMRPQVRAQASSTEQEKESIPTNRGSRKRKKSVADTPDPQATKRTKQSEKTSKRGKSQAQVPEVEEEIIEETSSDDEIVDDQENNTPSLRRSTRNRKTRNMKVTSDNENGSDFEMEDVLQSENDDQEQPVIKVEENDAEFVDDELEPDEQPTAPQATFDLEEEEEEKKLKPILQLRYQGFSIHDRCLCVVVEPWPSLPPRAQSRAPSIAPGSIGMFRAPSIAPSEIGDQPAFEREKSARPLFLPDVYRNRSVTPAPGLSAFRAPSVFSSMNAHMDANMMDSDYEPLRMIDDDDEQFGMMAFSQALNAVSGETGGEQDGDDIEGSAMFADADEAREFA